MFNAIGAARLVGRLASRPLHLNCGIWRDPRLWLVDGSTAICFGFGDRAELQVWRVWISYKSLGPLLFCQFSKFLVSRVQAILIIVLEWKKKGFKNTFSYNYIEALYRSKSGYLRPCKIIAYSYDGSDENNKVLIQFTRCDRSKWCGEDRIVPWDIDLLDTKY